jgi:MFS family permease
MKEPLLGPLTIFGTIFVGLFMPLATIIFPAWFVFNGQSAQALGIFLGAQALGGLLGGLVFATIATKVSGYFWLILSNILSTVFFGAMLLTDPGSVWALALSFLVGTTSAGFYPIMNTAYYSRTPEKLFGRVNGASWALSLVALPVTSLLFGWVISITSASVAIGMVVASNAILTVVVWLYPSMKLLDTREAAVNVVKDEGLEVK